MRAPKDGRLTEHLWGGSHEKYINMVDCCQISNLEFRFHSIKSHHDGINSTVKVSLRGLNFDQLNRQSG